MSIGLLDNYIFFQKWNPLISVLDYLSASMCSQVFETFKSQQHI